MIRGLIAAAIVSIAAPYACSPVYRFAEPRPFAGATLHNPYAHLRREWRRANLHAHGRAWAGLTDGAQTDAEVVAAYHGMGYDLAGISDYQRIADPAIAPLPEYEHGYNIRKTHQLAIGANQVVWLDFPLWQGLNQKQYILERLRPTTDLVSISHPARRDGYTVEDMRYLTGYQLVEVINGRQPSEQYWDAALSAGHLVWGIAGDDIHDLTDRPRVAVAWTMINAESTRRGDIAAALRDGRSYFVYRHGPAAASAETALSAVTLEAETITVAIAGPPATIGFVGQDGRIAATVGDTTSASYTFTPHDTYIRAVVRGPSIDFYLNPIVRSDGGVPVQAPAEISPGWTVAWRLTIATGGILVLLAGVRRRQRTRRSQPTASMVR